MNLIKLYFTPRCIYCHKNQNLITHIHLENKIVIKYRHQSQGFKVFPLPVYYFSISLLYFLLPSCCVIAIQKRALHIFLEYIRFHTEELPACYNLCNVYLEHNLFMVRDSLDQGHLQFWRTGQTRLFSLSRIRYNRGYAHIHSMQIGIAVKKEFASWSCFGPQRANAEVGFFFQVK